MQSYQNSLHVCCSAINGFLMKSFFNRNNLNLEDKTTGSESIEVRRKRIYILIGISFSVPILTGYGIFYFLQNKPLDGLLNLAVAVSLIVISLLIMKTGSRFGLYRFGMASLLLLLVYNVGFAPFGESEALWLIVIPMVIFYLFGTREGLIWMGVTIVPSAILIFFPDTFNAYSYKDSFRIALFIAILLSLILSYFLESLRAHFSSRLEKQNMELQDALSNVKRLSGLLPICSYCKKIRDDEGYWNQIESYIHDHSEATFSHGICKECAKQHYPDMDLYDDNETQG